MEKLISLCLLVSVMFASKRGEACDPALWAEPADYVGVTWAPERLEAPVGGLWIVSTTSPRLVLVDTETGAELVLGEDDIAFAGPTALAFRVPAQARPGQAFEVRTADRSRVLRVSDDEPVPAGLAAPSIRAVTAETGTRRTVQACTLGFAEVEDRSYQIVRVDAALPEGLTPEEVLLDAWVLPEGEPRPGDDAPRALDAFPVGSAPADGGGVAFHVGRPGAWRVDVRIRDPRTGLASEVESVEIVNEEPAFAGWDLLGGWHWGCASTSPSDAGLLASLALSLLGLRRSRGRGARRP